MQPRPTASELLAVVAEVLEREIVPALDGPAQHHARVAASLVGIVERELRLAPAQVHRELGAIRTLGIEADSVSDARARLAEALRAGMADDPQVDERVWSTLFASVRDDLAISKPGHDSWEGD
jgi:Domain of unknown function (DUF6285)